LDIATAPKQNKTHEESLFTVMMESTGGTYNRKGRLKSSWTIRV